MKTCLSILTFLITFSSAIAQEKAAIYGNLIFGKHPVGTQVIAYHHTPTGLARSISIRLWYPATQSDSTALTLADYINPTGNLDQKSLEDYLATGMTGATDGVPSQQLKTLLNSKVQTTLNANMASGTFPLLLWSVRYETVQYQWLLSEFLASHGYVVAFVEDIPHAPFPWAIPNPEAKQRVLQDQITDLETALTHLKQLPVVNPDQIGLLAWSYAGESAVLTQIANSDIDVVVGFSGIGFSSGIYSGKELATQATVDRLQVPYLILSERIGTNGKERTPPSFFDAMHPKSRYISFTSLAHGNFNAMEGMLPGVSGLTKVQPWSKGGVLAQQGYEAICNSTLSYLNSLFQKDTLQHFDRELRTMQQQLPKKFMRVIAPKH